jgi:ABC-type multidrug transport system permease subunit
MARQTEVASGAARVPTLHGGRLKLVLDALTILEMRLIAVKREWYWYLISALVFPMSMFYWSRALGAGDPEAVRRLMIGAVIMGVSIQTVNGVGQAMISDRFQGKLKLLITMPISKVSYALGMMAWVGVQTVVIVALLLTVSLIVGVDFTLTWAFFPLILAMVLTMAGATLFIASYAPTLEVGGIMTAMFGIVLVMISPVFFTMDQAPLLLKWLGHVSPLRYAADGIMESLSGGTDVWVEMAILVGFATFTLSLGLWKLRWRES